MHQVLLSDIERKDTVGENLRAFLMDAPESRGSYVDGIVGPSALQLKTLNLDFQQGVISWTL
jgi:hypothetical protein